MVWQLGTNQKHRRLNLLTDGVDIGKIGICCGRIRSDIWNWWQERFEKTLKVMRTRSKTRNPTFMWIYRRNVELSCMSCKNKYETKKLRQHKNIFNIKTYENVTDATLQKWIDRKLAFRKTSLIRWEFALLKTNENMLSCPYHKSSAHLCFTSRCIPDWNFQFVFGILCLNKLTLNIGL